MSGSSWMALVSMMCLLLGATLLIHSVVMDDQISTFGVCAIIVTYTGVACAIIFREAHLALFVGFAFWAVIDLVRGIVGGKDWIFILTEETLTLGTFGLAVLIGRFVLHYVESNEL